MSSQEKYSKVGYAKTEQSLQKWWIPIVRLRGWGREYFITQNKNNTKFLLYDLKMFFDNKI